MAFEGPAFQCSVTVRNYTSGDPRTHSPQSYYTGGWGSYNQRHLISNSFDTRLERHLGYSGDTVLREVHESHCQPASAHYLVSFEYTNGVRTFSHSMKNATILQNSIVAGVGPNLSGDGPNSWKGGTRVWTEDEIQTLKSLNHYALLDTIVTPLAGSYDQNLEESEAPAFSFTLDNGTEAVFTPLRSVFLYGFVEPKARNGSSGANFEIGKQRRDELRSGVQRITLTPSQRPTRHGSETQCSTRIATVSRLAGSKSTSPKPNSMK